MAIPGPKPKPGETKRLQGNPGHRPLNENEPKPPAGAPDMPSHLNDDAQAAWQWLVDMLQSMNLLVKSDLALMSLYAETWAEYVKIRRDVNKHGFVMVSPKTGMPFTTPHLNIEAMLKKQLMTCISELGLSPPSRARLKVKDNDKDDDPITDLLALRYGTRN